jgi:hypothetical protein
VSWMLLLIGAVFVASLLFLAVCSVIGLVRFARAWRRQPAHASTGPTAVEPWPPPGFGSMDLETDRALGEWKHEPAVAGWRERTAAELDPYALAIAHEEESSRAALTLVSAEIAATHPEPAPAPAVESRSEWLDRLIRNAGPGWTFAGELAAA